MFYDFQCDPCGETETVWGTIKTGPERHPTCDLHGHMRRLYGDTQLHVHYGKVDYIEQAYRGEIDVPSMTTPQIRAIVDKSREHIVRGRANERVYRTLR